MQGFYRILLLALVVLSCSRNNGTGKGETMTDKKIKKEVMSVTENYILSQIPDAKKSTSKDGVITFGSDSKRYVIEPGKIFTGLIDDDDKADAIISLDRFDSQNQIESEQLVLLNSSNGFIVGAAIGSDMRIISLENRIITADVPEHRRSTPLFSCPSCWEVVKFNFKKGELAKIE